MFSLIVQALPVGQTDKKETFLKIQGEDQQGS